MSPSMHPLPEDPAAWRGPDLAGSPDWVLTLAERQRGELVDLGQRLESSGLGLDHALSPAAPQIPSLPAALLDLMREIRHTLRDGRGFVLMRGFPVEAMSMQASRLAYAALGSALGSAMPQNRQGERLHDVRDTGADPRDPGVRLSVTRAEQDFHTDAADVIGLLCLKTARSGGVSRIVSSVSVYRAVAATRPDLAPLLFEPWTFHLKGEQPEGAPPYFRLPIAHATGGRLSTFFIGWYIRDAERLPGVPPLSPAQRELLDLYERTANSPALYLDMHFQSGDIQWLKNSVILHKRTQYEDWPEPERKRHLLRLWLAAEDFDDGIVALRRGHSASLHRDGIAPAATGSDVSTPPKPRSPA